MLARHPPPLRPPTGRGRGNLTADPGLATRLVGEADGERDGLARPWGWACAVTVVAAVVVGTALRLWGATTKGLVLGDEASYTLIAQTLVQPIQWFFSWIAGWSERDLASHMFEFMGPAGRQVGFPPGNKPLFYLLVMAVGLPLSFPPYTAVVVSALLGSISVFLVWQMVAESRDRRLAALSAVLLAVSPYHLLYSRLGLANVAASAFLLVAGVLMLRSQVAGSQAMERRYVVLTGLTLGCAALVHPAVLPQIALFPVAETMGLLTERSLEGRTRLLWRLKWTGLAALVPLAAVEATSWAALALKGRLLPSVAWHQTFVTDFFVKSLAEAGSRGRTQPLFQISLLDSLEGTLSLLLALIGTVVCIRNLRSPFYRLVGLQVWVPFVLWSLSGLQVPRTFVSAVPFLTIIAAAGALAAARVLARGRTALERGIVLAILLVAIGGRAPALGEILSLRSGYADAIAYLREHGAARHLATHRTISQAYVGIPKVVQPPADQSLPSLARVVSEGGYRYLLADVSEVLYESVAVVRARCRPVASVRNAAFDFWPLLADRIEAPALRDRAWQSPHRSRIDIFDLRECL